MMKLFGYKFKQQSIDNTSPDGIVDKVIFQYKSGNEVTLFNFLREEQFKLEPLKFYEFPLN